jgi:hypothetical protein
MAREEREKERVKKRIEEYNSFVLNLYQSVHITQS